MDSLAVKISSVNQGLSGFNGTSGLIVFELNQSVDEYWRKAFFHYLYTYKPYTFSGYSPEIIEDRYIRAHIEIDGPWNVENVLMTLKSMVTFANAKCVNDANRTNRAFQLTPANVSAIGSFSDRLSILNFE